MPPLLQSSQPEECRATHGPRCSIKRTLHGEPNGEDQAAHSRRGNQNPLAGTAWRAAGWPRQPLPLVLASCPAVTPPVTPLAYQMVPGGASRTPRQGTWESTWPRPRRLLPGTRGLSNTAAVYEGESGGRWVAAASHDAESRAVQKKPEGKAKEVLYMALLPHSRRRLHLHPRPPHPPHPSAHIPISDTRPRSPCSANRHRHT